MQYISFRGTVTSISETKRRSEKWATKTVVFEEIGGGNYPEYYSVDFVNENIERVEGCRLGDEATVTAGIRGVRYTRKDSGDVAYFTSLNGTDITWHIAGARRTETDEAWAEVAQATPRVANSARPVQVEAEVIGRARVPRERPLDNDVPF